METVKMVKLISSILISITLITKNDALKKDDVQPVDLERPTATVSTTRLTSSTNKPVSSTTTSTSTISTSTSLSVDQSMKNKSTETKSPMPSAGHQKNQPIIKKNNDVEVFNTTRNTTGSAAAYHSISMHEEKTATTSSLWIYITIGILGVAFINFYAFWYRKRASTYSFVPKTTTQRR